MANSYQRLAASRPANTSEAKLYGPASSVQVIATLLVCNQDSVDRNYSIALTDTDAAAAGEDWIVYERNISPNMTHDIAGLCLENPNTIRIQASVADKISFVLYGLEIS